MSDLGFEHATVCRVGCAASLPLMALQLDFWWEGTRGHIYRVDIVAVRKRLAGGALFRGEAYLLPARGLPSPGPP